MNKTPNYQLNQWEKNDRIQMEDFNADNAKIEAALEAQAAAIANGGNCKVVTGTYKGTGKYGSGNKNTLSFDGSPFLVIVAGSRGFTALRGATGTSCFGSGGGEPYAMNLIWGTNSLSWYAGNNANMQCNNSNETYYYCACFLAE